MEPGPRCDGVFNNDFLVSGDVTFAVAGVVISLFCCEGGKGIADCLLLAAVVVEDFVGVEDFIEVGVEDFIDVGVVNVGFIEPCWGGVEEGLYCCCCCCVIEVVLTRGKPIFALTWVNLGPADWRYNFLFAAIVAAVDAIGVIGIVVGNEGTGGISGSDTETADEVLLWVGFLYVVIPLSCKFKLFLIDEDLVVCEEVEGVITIPVPVFTLPSEETLEEGIGC